MYKESLQLAESGVQSSEMQRVHVDAPSISEHGDQKEDSGQLAALLRSIGMSHYLPLFVEQGFASNMAMLYELEDKHLRDMGIDKMADRMQLIKTLNGHQREGGAAVNAQFVEREPSEDSDDRENENMYSTATATMGDQV